MNIGKCQNEQIKIFKKAEKMNIDVIILQEPYTNKYNNLALNFSNNYNTVSSNNGSRSKAAMAFKKSIKYLIDERLSNENFVVAVVNDTVLVSGYFNLKDKNSGTGKEVDRTIELDLNQIQKIMISHKNKKLVIAIDSNARHMVFGDKKTNDCGSALYEYMIQEDLTIENDTNAGPTFEKIVTDKNTNTKIVRSSYIDITMTNNKATNMVSRWKLLRNALDTEHNLIYFEINCIKHENKLVKEVSRSLLLNKFNAQRFLNIYNKLKPTLDATSKLDVTIFKFDTAIEEAMKQITSKKISIKSAIPWYNEELNEIHNNVMKLRRKINQVNKKHIENEKAENLRSKMSELRKRYKKELYKSKSEFYENLHNVKNEIDFWKVYNRFKPKQKDKQIIFDNNKSRSAEENEELLRFQFVKPDEETYRPVNFKCTKGLEPTGINELNAIINNLDNKKAPGPDGISNKLIKLIYANNKKYIVDLFNLILQNREIPRKWKYGRLIYFPKPNRDIKLPSDYRPITLLNNFCKLAECLIIKRINNKLNEVDFYSNLQYGFKKKTSTIDAIKSMYNKILDKKNNFKKVILICLDMSSAFDTIKWQKIIDNLLKSNLSREHIMACQNLLIERKVFLNDNVIESERGTPQGGKASPSLWKIGMNPEQFFLLINIEIFR